MLSKVYRDLEISIPPEISLVCLPRQYPTYSPRGKSLFWLFPLIGLFSLFQSFLLMKSYSLFVFWGWLLSLGILFSRFVHIVACNSSLLLSIPEEYPTVRMYHCLLIHSLVYDTWAIPQTAPPLSAVFNRDAMNIDVFVFLWTQAFFSLG